MNRKKILMVIPTFGFGGAQKVFYNLGQELNSFYEIIECGFNNENNIVYPSNNKIIYLNIEGSDNFIGKGLNFIKRILKLNTVKKVFQPDIVISHLEGADYINLLSTGSAKKIICIHGTKVHDGKIKGILGLIRKKILIPNLYRKANHIITVSSEIKDELIHYYNIEGNKISVIYNWFDIAKIQHFSLEPIEDNYSVLFDQKVIILSGRFDIQKNFVRFLSVIQKVLIKDPSIRFIILGDGELRNELIQKTNELSIPYYSPWSASSELANASLVYLGYQKNPYKFLKKSNLFIMPSNWEGFPLALGEAMVCGVPVVSSNCPTGPAEMLDFSNGSSTILTSPEFTQYGTLLPLLTDDKNIQSLWAEFIIQHIQDEDRLKQYSHNSKERINRYTKDKIIKEWTTLLNQIS